MEKIIFGEKWIDIDVFIKKLEKKKELGAKYLPFSILLDKILDQGNENEFENLKKKMIEEMPILTEPLDKFKSRFTGDYLYEPDYDIDTPENRFEFLEYLRNKK